MYPITFLQAQKIALTKHAIMTATRKRNQNKMHYTLLKSFNFNIEGKSDDKNTESTLNTAARFIRLHFY